MKKLTTVLLILVFAAGLSLLLYPTVSEWWNSTRHSKAIQSYEAGVSLLDEETLQAMWAAAVEYNEKLNSGGLWSLSLHSEEALAEYEALLNPLGTGMMGYIEIAKIGVYIPIYHGTDASTLNKNIGHIEGSALPVGGAGTHCILSGHRGLTSARLFTDIDLLSEGDTFMLHVLDKTLTYEVDKILTVLPEEIAALAPEAGKDYCTLVTCTPYGVNSHRLLVRGRRVDNDPDAVVVTGDAYRISSLTIAPVVAAPILLALLVLLLIRSKRPAKGGGAENPFVSPESGAGGKTPEQKTTRGGRGRKKRSPEKPAGKDRL